MYVSCQSLIVQKNHTNMNVPFPCAGSIGTLCVHRLLLSVCIVHRRIFTPIVGTCCSVGIVQFDIGYINDTSAHIVGPNVIDRFPSLGDSPVYLRFIVADFVHSKGTSCL